MRAHSFHGWQNVFQTAPFNGGLRLEMGSSGTLALVVSSVFPLSKNLPPLIQGFKLVERAQPERWYDVRIEVEQSKYLRAWVDGLPVVRETIEDWIFSVSAITVGVGFDQSRLFDGMVRDFDIRYRLMHPLSRRGRILLDVALFGLLPLVLAVALAAVAIARFRNGRWSPASLRAADLAAPVLWAVFPALFLASANLHQGTFQVPISEVIQLALWSAGGAFLAAALWACLLADSLSGGLVATCWVILFFAAGRLWTALAPLGLFSPDGFVAILLGFCACLCLGALRLRRGLQAGLARFSAMAAALLILFSIIPLARRLVAAPPRNTGTQSSGTPVAAPLRGAATANRDIYYLVLDAYGGEQALGGSLGFDNSGFLGFLRKRGFYVAAKSSSNYRTTELSIPSSMNMAYHPLGADTGSLLAAMTDGGAARFLRARGYKTVWINPFHAILDHNPHADIELDGRGLSPFRMAFWRTTLLFRQPQRRGEDKREETLFYFDALAEAAAIPGPKFVFAHVLCPHHPYVVNARGGLVPEAEQDDQITDGRAVLNKKGYLGQIAFLNKRLEEILPRLQEAGALRPIIIIQGDHGPELFKTVAMTRGDEFPPAAYHRARMSILNAFYFPDGGEAALYPTITPVNSFRVLFDRYFGASFPRLPDRNYYSPDMDLFRFRDITGIVGSIYEKKNN